MIQRSILQKKNSSPFSYFPVSSLPSQKVINIVLNNFWSQQQQEQHHFFTKYRLMEDKLYLSSFCLSTARQMIHELTQNCITYSHCKNELNDVNGLLWWLLLMMIKCETNQFMKFNFLIKKLMEWALAT